MQYQYRVACSVCDYRIWVRSGITENNSIFSIVAWVGAAWEDDIALSAGSIVPSTALP